MNLKGKIEAVIYAAEEPVTLEQMAALLHDEIAAELEAREADPSAAAHSRDELNHRIRQTLREIVDALIAEYASSDRGIEVRQVAGGYRMATKPEHHDVVRAFAKSIRPPVRLSLAALETLAVIAYKQPVTAPEISEIRGVDSSGVLGTLLDRKLIITAGRKAVIGRPILYRTTKEFLLHFGLKDVTDLPSMEEFEKLAGGTPQGDLFVTGAVADATGIPEVPELQHDVNANGAPVSEASAELAPAAIETAGPSED